MKTWNKYVFFDIVTILVLGSWLIWLYFHYQAMEKGKDSAVIDVATDTTNDEVEVEVELVGKESEWELGLSSKLKKRVRQVS